MTIQALFFASYRELLGTSELSVELPESVTVAGMVARLRAMGDGLAGLPEVPVVAVNEEYASLGTVLRDGDVVAFIPPVAGG